MSAEASYIFAATGLMISVLWIYLYLISTRRFFDILKAVSEKTFPCKSLLRPGFAFMSLTHNVLSGIAGFVSGIGNGRKMDDFTSYCAASYAVSLAVPAISCGFLISAISGRFTILLMFSAIAILCCIYPFYRYRENEKERNRRLENQLPVAIGKTVLLCEAGCTVSDAWNTVALSANGELYDEMRRVSEQIRNGMSPDVAFSEFADRCPVKEAKQFSGIIIRQASKGGDGVIEALRTLNTESWQERMHRATLKGQAASEAMLLPMLMIFIGIIILVAVPLLAEMNY